MLLIRLRRFVSVAVLGGALAIAPLASASAASGPSVHGGGIVGGDLGTTSQLAVNATDAGGTFLCLMAGRSGGFPFDQWDSVSQMLVQGRVTPGSLHISGDVAWFEGTATIHVVGKNASGVLTVTLTDMHFKSTQAAGGAGVAWHLLEVTGLPPFGPAPLIAGRITISD